MCASLRLMGARQLIDQAKRYDVKVIYHSCGGIRDIIPGLIDLGVDAIHPIQALAVGMGRRRSPPTSAIRSPSAAAWITRICWSTARRTKCGSKVRALRAALPDGLDHLAQPRGHPAGHCRPPTSRLCLRRPESEP